MEYNQNQLMSLSNEELNNFRGLNFHITFTNKRAIKPNINEVVEGNFNILNTVSSGNLSKPVGLLSGFIVREINSDDENSVSFLSIKKMVSIDFGK